VSTIVYLAYAYYLLDKRDISTLRTLVGVSIGWFVFYTAIQAITVTYYLSLI